MKISKLSDKEKGSNMLLKILGLVAAAVITVTTLYGIIAAEIQGVDVVGETFVTIEFPPVSAFPLFYSKPITWLSASILVLWYVILELNKNSITSISFPIRRFLKLVCFFIGSMAAYEVLFNFTLWSGLIASNAILGSLDPDVIKNVFPNPKSPWNIVFATKLFTVLTIISWYTFYFLQRLESKKIPDLET